MEASRVSKCYRPEGGRPIGRAPCCTRRQRDESRDDVLGENSSSRQTHGQLMGEESLAVGMRV